MKKITVVWICAFSNSEVRKHYSIRIPWIMKVIYGKKNKSKLEIKDFGNWNTFAIKEFEKFDDIDLHIVSPIRFLSEKKVNFDISGIHYHYFRDENSSVCRQIYYQLFKKNSSDFIKNRACISTIINNIKPDIVHVIGAENPYYSLAILDVKKPIITIIQLQALLVKAALETEVEEEKKSFTYKGDFETEIFRKVDYIGTEVISFRNFITERINTKCKFLDISIAAAEPINTELVEKKYDFVYWSVDISKAFDFALESFALAHDNKESLTLDVVGGFTPEYKKIMDARISDLGLTGCIKFEGLLPSHNDVINQIKKSKYALLPLKMDMVPGTIREAMACGLPVVTTITKGGTPLLNKDMECVLLSEQKDYLAMAENMLKLVNDDDYAQKLAENGLKLSSQSVSNRDMMLRWVDAYQYCLKNKDR